MRLRTGNSSTKHTSEKTPNKPKDCGNAAIARNKKNALPPFSHLHIISH
jgi:hypothetical protein